MMQDRNSKIYTGSVSLAHYFYSELSLLNKKSICPLPEEFILYSSEIMDSYAKSEKFYDSESGRMKNKILGMKLLTVESHDLAKKIEMYKDVGDSALVQIGFFEENCNKRVVDRNYYLELGKTAYYRLGDYNQSFYGLPEFYKRLSSSLNHLVSLINSYKQMGQFKNFEKYLLEKEEDIYFSHSSINKAS